MDVPAILDKHKAAADVCQAALTKAIALCVADADISTICGEIDKFIDEELLKVFSNKKSKKLDRGIAFPCCLSVNEMCGHYSPCADESKKLVNEDLVKIEFGAHIDGYTANIAHTVIIGGKAKDKKAAVVLAAYDAFQAATRTIKTGATNHEVTANIQKVCTEYGVEPL